MNELAIHFEMNLQDLNQFLGLEMEKGTDGIFISQRQYAWKLVEKFSMKQRKA